MSQDKSLEPQTSPQQIQQANQTQKEPKAQTPTPTEKAVKQKAIKREDYSTLPPEIQLLQKAFNAEVKEISKD